MAMVLSVRLPAVTSVTLAPSSVNPSRRSTLFISPSGRYCNCLPARSYTASPPSLSVPMTVLRDGSSRSTQIAGSSAASSPLGTGSVSTTAATVSPPVVAASLDRESRADCDTVALESSTPQPVTANALAVSAVTIGISQPLRLISLTSPSLQ